MSTPEGKVKDALKKYLKKLGAWQYWPVSNGMGKHGIPDCIICYNGRFLSVECKAPGKKPTALQEREGKEILKAGGFWMVFDGSEGAWLELRVGMGEMSWLQDC